MEEGLYMSTSYILQSYNQLKQDLTSQVGRGVRKITSNMYIVEQDVSIKNTTVKKGSEFYDCTDLGSFCEKIVIDQKSNRGQNLHTIFTRENLPRPISLRYGMLSGEQEVLTQNTLATDSSGMFVGHRYSTISTSNDKVLYDAESPKAENIDIVIDHLNDTQYNVPTKKNIPSGTVAITMKPMH